MTRPFPQTIARSLRDGRLRDFYRTPGMHLVLTRDPVPLEDPDCDHWQTRVAQDFGRNMEHVRR